DLTIRLVCDRAVNRDSDYVNLEFEPYRDPKAPKIRNWPCRVTINSNNPKEIKVTCQIPADAAIGEYLLFMTTWRRGNNTASQYSVPNIFYIIFNPWHGDDAVYL